jgi:AraC-like DNA-binding protein
LEQPNARFEFDSSAINGTINRKDLIHGEAMVVDAYEGTVKKTMQARLRIGAETLALFLMRKGTALIWGEADKRWFVMPPQSVTYVRGPINFLMSFARSEHRLESVAWHAKSMPFMTEWLERQKVRNPKGDRPRVLATMPYNPIFTSVIQRFDDSCAGNAEMVEPMIYSVVYELLPRLVRSRSRLGLAPVPGDLPANITQLVTQVRQRPDVAWPLKDAADLVGYSPFHFSRVYKSLIGYGFHEFVDRCRTEHAVDLLCTTETPIDVVAAASGFGTTQALRESVKEYLGLVPSELRASPDEYDLVR